jgi:HEAT repeat protein
VDRIKQAAVEDRDPDVRAHALFSLSQTRSKGAGEWIVSRLDAEKDDHVREQAVFALSQLPDGTDWLLHVLRSKRDTETVRHALFWLGQSKDPRAFDELEKILDR